MLFSYPLMAAIQEISGRIGRTTGRGVAGNIPAWLLNAIVGLLFIANTINIGADLGAMGDALSLLVGGPHRFLCRARGCLCVVLQIFVPYKRYVSVLKWLTLSPSWSCKFLGGKWRAAFSYPRGLPDKFLTADDALKLIAENMMEWTERSLNNRVRVTGEGVHWKPGVDPMTLPTARKAGPPIPSRLEPASTAVPAAAAE
jgi:hypothetical protein